MPFDSASTGPATRLARARIALDGLSVGDAFGQRHSEQQDAAATIEDRVLPNGPWRTTDDTETAMAVFEQLAKHGEIRPDDLARTLARRYRDNPYRGYNAGAHKILDGIARGLDWRALTRHICADRPCVPFAAAAVIGAYFADDLDKAAQQARAAACVLDANLEGHAGAVAVAIAAAVAWTAQDDPARRLALPLIDAAIERTPRGETRTTLQNAQRLGPEALVGEAAILLCRGGRRPPAEHAAFALWCAQRNPGDFANALWTAVTCPIERDSVCAITGALVALSAGRNAIPAEWLDAREPLQVPATETRKEGVRIAM